MNKHVDPEHLAVEGARPSANDVFGDYFRAAESWENEIHRTLRASRLRAWIAAAIASGIALLALTAIVILLPLKTYAPYVIEVDKTTGHIEVMRPLAPSATAPDVAITEANLVRWIVGRETYDPADIRQRFEEVSRLSADDALADYRRLWTPDAPTNPAIAFGWTTRVAVTVKAVSLLKPDTAAVRYMLTKTDDRTGTVSTSHWVAIVSFRYSDAPMRVRDRWANPLGFQVTGFRADQEALRSDAPSRVTPQDAPPARDGAKRP